ncbi:uncharacterized protein PHALS_04257 [Plasmopara halstedii]|uniref:Uncharacterized protein n=1 Tax=Plasmopara halstedii TaxID=4781 RepID=A0A0P1B1T1_PLAHL|nr:uncharacterized protein PHALS_04257 [Plasmopara halstedii]CEG47377.1 hypothetical protein PHALS_04257 [Plasmopara halstedii]|eukprot:XP_024583746.1 hypothetical protein PHALS_04257 [Plasmopara halstedii]
MNAQAKWRQRTPAKIDVRRSKAASAAFKITEKSSSSNSTTFEHPTTILGQPRPLKQAEEPSIGASIEAEDASSRWKEMRQAVRTKATFETTENKCGQAKIADLCPVDREKVSKLVHRVVEIGSLHEEAKEEFEREKEMHEAEVTELRQHIKRATEEIQDLSDELRNTRRKAQLFEERVVILEESIDSETRLRLEAEQTLDMLRLEVEKLRALVQQQQGEMQREANVRQKHYDDELLRVREDLKQAQELLLTEKNERLYDKQKVLDQRLERSTAADDNKLHQLYALLVQQQYDLQVKAKAEQEKMRQDFRQQQESTNAKMSQLKFELNAAQELLQQEREKQTLEKVKTNASSNNSFEKVVQGEPIESSDRQNASPIQHASALETKSQLPHYTDMQGDLALFEEVKDLYAEDLFASRKWQTVAFRFESAPWLTSSAALPSVQGKTNSSTLDVSVQEAVENDMQLQLRLDSIY